MAANHPRRSALYVPASNTRAVDKALTLSADVLIFDLEDAVAPDEKAYARQMVEAVLGELADDRRELVVRINGLDSPWIARDLAVMATAQPDAVLVPKIARTEDIRRIRAAMAAAAASRDIELWAMVETPAAILHAAEIAAIAAMPSPSLTCFVVGTNDLAADLRATITPGREALLPHLAHILAAGRAHGLAVIDGTFNDIGDEDGFRTECEQAARLGMDGKTLIHPSQIAAANRAFAPSPDDIAWARRVVEAFAVPDASARSVIRIGNRMVERLHERQARRTLDLDAAIRELERGRG